MSNESTSTTTRKPELKPIEVGVGAAAAVITAFASSYLGTAGTLSGAALASVVGTVSTSVLRRSAERSSERLRQTTARLKDRTGTFPVDPAAPAPPGDADIDPYGTQLFGAGTTFDADPRAAQTAAAPAGSTSARAVRPRWVVLAAGAVTAFAVALVAITGIESAVGKPLAALIGDETGGGTTVGRATGTDSGASKDKQRTTPSPTDTPSGTTTATTSSEPTPGDSASPTDVPQGTQSGAPSVTTGAPATTAPAPTAVPTGGATPNPTP